MVENVVLDQCARILEGDLNASVIALVAFRGPHYPHVLLMARFVSHPTWRSVAQALSAQK